VEELSSLLAKIVANKVEIWLALTTTVTAAAAMAALTPNPKDDSWVAKIRKVIDIFGWNWGFAANHKKTDKTE
jgi:uncharacterized glyoxalase superfamily protein PhnB